MDLTKYDIIGLNDENKLYRNMFIVIHEISIVAKRVDYFTHHLNRCIKDSDKDKLTLIVIANAIQIAGLIQILIDLRNDLIKTFTQPKKPMLLLPEHIE